MTKTTELSVGYKCLGCNAEKPGFPPYMVIVNNEVPLAYCASSLDCLQDIVAQLRKAAEMGRR